MEWVSLGVVPLGVVVLDFEPFFIFIVFFFFMDLSVVAESIPVVEPLVPVSVVVVSLVPVLVVVPLEDESMFISAPDAARSVASSSVSSGEFRSVLLRVSVELEVADDEPDSSAMTLSDVTVVPVVEISGLALEVLEDDGVISDDERSDVEESIVVAPVVPEASDGPTELVPLVEVVPLVVPMPAEAALLSSERRLLLEQPAIAIETNAVSSNFEFILLSLVIENLRGNANSHGKVLARVNRLRIFAEYETVTRIVSPIRQTRLQLALAFVARFQRRY